MEVCFGGGGGCFDLSDVVGVGSWAAVLEALKNVQAIRV